MFFQSPGGVLMHLAESGINLNQGSGICDGLDNFEQAVK